MIRCLNSVAGFAEPALSLIGLTPKIPQTLPRGFTLLEYTGALGETHEGSWVTEQLKMSEGSWTSGVPSSAQDWSANLDSN